MKWFRRTVQCTCNRVWSVAGSRLACSCGLTWHLHPDGVYRTEEPRAEGTGHAPAAPVKRRTRAPGKGKQQKGRRKTAGRKQKPAARRSERTNTKGA